MNAQERAQIAVLAEILARVEKKIDEDATIALAHRENVTRSLDAMSAAHKALVARVDITEPAIADFRNLQANFRGALFLLALVGSIVALPLALGWKWLWGRITGQN